MRNKRRIAALLAIVMIVSSLFAGPVDVRASELITDSVDETVFGDELVPEETAADDVVFKAEEPDVIEEADTTDSLILDDEEEGTVDAAPEEDEEEIETLFSDGDTGEPEAETEPLNDTAASVTYTVTYDFGDGYYLKWDEKNAVYNRVKTLSCNVVSGNTLYNGNAYPDSYIKNDDLHYSFKGFSETRGGTSFINENYRVKGNVTFYAVWERDRYVVTYDANPAAGGYYEVYNDETRETEILSSNKVAVPIGSDGKAFVYKYDGQYKLMNSDAKMAFAGWYTDASCTTEPAWDSSKYSFEITGDTTIYTKWTASNVVISFDPNGGYYYNRVEKKRDTSPKKYGGAKDSIDDDKRIDNPKHEDLHKRFKGWYLDNTCQNLAFAAQDGRDYTSVSLNYAGEKTYYAGWEDKYKVVTVDAGDGQFKYWDDDTGKWAKATIAKFRLDEYGRITDSFDNPEYKDTSKAFIGWYVGDEHISPWSYQSDKDFTVTARYDSYYKVTLDACGGYFDYIPDYGQTSTLVRVPQGKRFGDTCDPYDNTPLWVDDTKAFGGWYLDSTYKNPAGELDSFVPGSDMTLYAKWLNRYTVTYDAGQGKIYGKTTYSITDREGNSYELRSVIGNVKAPEGQAFVGWYWDREFKNPADETATYKYTDNVTLYAKYTKAYKVTFDANGGAFAIQSRKNPYTVLIAEGESIKGKVPTVKSTEVKAFKGWFLDKACSPDKEVKNLYEYPVTSDITLYAGYTECYTITFKTNNTNAKFYNGTDTVIVRVVKGEAYRYGEDDYDSYDYSCQAPAFATVSGNKLATGYWSDNVGGTGNKYYFTGSRFYYTDASGKQTVGNGMYGFVPTQDMTFYAAWADPVTITAHANGGKFGRATSNKGELSENDTVWTTTIPKGATISKMDRPGIRRDGFYFDTWYKDADCKTPVGSDPIESNMHVYAGWKQSGSGGGGGGGSSDNYTISLHAGEGYFYDNIAQKIIRNTYTSFGPGRWFYFYVPMIDDDNRAFSTWYFDEKCTKPVSESDIIRYSADEWQVRLNERVTDLYAGYGKATKVAINANGGYFDESSSRHKDPSESLRTSTLIRTKVLSGDRVDISGYTRRVRRDGDKIFAGWYTDKACQNKAVTYVDSSSNEYFIPQGDTTLYAKWIDYDKATSITVAAAKTTLKVGEDPIKLTATVTPESAKNSQTVHWWIVDRYITSTAYEAYRKYPIMLKSDGTVVPQAPGKVTLYAEINGVKSDTITIEVVEDESNPTLKVAPSKLSLKFGETAALTATVTPVTKGGNVTWTTADKSIADVTGNNLTAVVTAGSKEGKTTITATRGNLSVKVEVEVVAAPGVFLDIHEATLVSRADSKIKLTATVKGTGYSVDTLKWSSSNTRAATVEGGTVTAVTGLEDAATTDIKVQTPDGKYSDTCKITVRPASMLAPPTANVPSGEVAKGTRIMLKTGVNGADICYTTDGTDPTVDNSNKPTNSTKIYEDAIIIDGDTTIKAVTVMTGYKKSPVATFTYLTSVGWGDITDAEKAMFGNDANKVPAGIWYYFTGENKPYDKSATTSFSKEYTGEKITFDNEVNVFYGTSRLVDSRDYKVTYKNSKKVAVATASKAPAVRVKGKGNYDGTATFTYNINPANLSKAHVETALSVALKSGTALSTVKPVVSYIIKNKNKKLAANKDYDLTYYKGTEKVDASTKVEAGVVYTITITGHAGGNFTGKTSDITVTGVDASKVINMGDASVSDLVSAYTGKDIDLAALLKAATVKVGSETLTYGTDYTVLPIDKTAYPLYPSTGEYPVTLRGLKSTSRECVGDKVVTLNIHGTRVTKVACLNTKPEYTGKVLTATDLYKKDNSGLDVTVPTPYVEVSGKAVAVPASDFVADYSKLRAEGKTTVTYTFKNGYTGKITKKITVKPYNIANDSKKLLDVKVSKAAYCKAGAIPEVNITFNGKQLREGIDYTLKCTGNRKITDTAVVKIKGIGNFTGTKEEKFSILKTDIENAVLLAKDKKYTDKKNNFKSTVKVTDGGKNLPKSYAKFDKKDVKYYYAATGTEIPENTKVDPGTVVEARVTVTCPASSPYYGTAELVTRYRIADKKNWLSKAKITFKDTDSFVFANGNEIIPLKKSDIVVTLDGVTLSDSDYDIVSVTNNRFIGKGKIEIRGKGKYGGTKKQSFSIKKRTVSGTSAK